MPTFTNIFLQRLSHAPGRRMTGPKAVELPMTGPKAQLPTTGPATTGPALKRRIGPKALVTGTRIGKEQAGWT